MIEHDYEPVPGLPAQLPKGETILWQGSPEWKTLARRVMRVRIVAGYFVLLAIWGISGRLSSGMSVPDVAASTFRLCALGAVALSLMLLFAWLAARTTIYTITTRRVVMRFGVALPMTIQIPFRTIEAAGSLIWPDGTGDVALKLLDDRKIAYLVIWPHARPWKLAKPQPMLRGIADAAMVAQILSRALATSASQPAKSVVVPISDAPEIRVNVPAAA